MMMKRLLDRLVIVYAVLYDNSITKASERANLDISDADWKVMESIVPILEPFVQAIE
jgi:hypothetical protein